MILTRKLFAVGFLALVLAVPAQAQFGPLGKNIVHWQNKELRFYESYHFDVWHTLDLNDPDQMQHFQKFIDNLEGAYTFYSSDKVFNHQVESRIPVIVYNTHSEFEANYITAEFLPEGVGAFVEPERGRLVTKEDLLPPLKREANAHELVHVFQFDIRKLGLLQRATGMGQLPQGFIEGGAEFIATLYEPQTRDDLRRIQQRLVASNPKSLPTWEALVHDQVDPYAMWMMVFQFLQDQYGQGVAFQVQGLQQKSRSLGELVYDLTKGELGNPDVNPEKFDQKAREYWSGKYQLDMINRPKPYQENGNFKGRSVTPPEDPYPMISPVLSPDGRTIAAFTLADNGISLVTFNVPDEPVYRDKAARDKARRENRQSILMRALAGTPKLITNLTPYLPPEPWEYLVVQGFETWPFNGSDQGWWQDAQWLKKLDDARDRLKKNRQDISELNAAIDKAKAANAKAKTAGNSKADQEKLAALEAEGNTIRQSLTELNKTPNVSLIAVFAKKNRDHALFIIDVNTRKIIRQTEVPLDQAFSPKFSPDGKMVYFSAAQDITRDLYALDLEVGGVKNLTHDERFDTAPAVSPAGSTLAYVGSDGDFQHLFLLHLSDGSKEQLTFGRFNDSSPSWSDDGTMLVYSSDEKDEIWNLYTLDLGARTVSQWTEFFGSAETPVFARGSTNKAYYTAFHDDDEYRGHVYPNHEVFEVTFKKPIRQYTALKTDVPMSYTFNPNRDLFGFQLDQNQILNPKKPPERWKLRGSDAYFGASTYYGMFAETQIQLSNMLETKHHTGLFAEYGAFKYLSYSYLNQASRTNWMAGGHYIQFPLLYPLYDIVKGYPNQPLLGNTWLNESEVDAAILYPKNRFNRVELFSRVRRRSYNLNGINEDVIQAYPDSFNPTDPDVLNFLNSSSGSSVSFGTAYVRDTVLFSGNTQGPFHGNAFRAQVEFAPPLGNTFVGYTAASIDARTYRHLGSSALFAARVAATATTHPNGDFVLMGGPELLRGKAYGSLIGNRVAYGSAELRFPLLDALVFPGGFGVGPLRGIMFVDAGIATFNNALLPAQRGTSVGGGIQFLPFNFLWTRENGQWKPTFYISMNW